MKQSGRKTHNYNIFILLLIAIVAAIFFLWGKRPPQSTPVEEEKIEREPVQIAAVRQAGVPVTLQALGNIVSEATVNVTSRVDGQLIKVLFTEGDEVKKGQLLAKIDPR